MSVYIIWLSLLFLGGFSSIRRCITMKGIFSDRRLRITNDNILLLLFLACGVFLIGFRDGGGVDDSQYWLFYEMGYGINKVNALLTSKEPFFILVRQIGIALGLNYKFMFLIYSICSMTFLCAALRNYGLNINHLSIYILGFFLIAYSPLFTTMRQTLAAAIVFYYYSLTKPTIKQKIILAVMAFCAHYGAIIVALIEIVRPIIDRKFNKISKIMIPVICLILASIIDFQSLIYRITSMIGMYEYMNADGNYLSSSNIGIFTYVLFGGYAVKVCIGKKSTEAENKIESLQCVYFLTAFLTAHLRWGTRIQLYYILFIPFILIEDLKCLSEESRKPTTFILAVLLIPCAIYAISQSPKILNAVRSVTFR